MNPKIYASATILAIVLVSACTIPGLEWPFGNGGALPGVTGLGLEMTSFTAEPSTVFSGSTVRLIMETENKGGTTVEDSEALIYLTGSNFDDWSDTSPLYDHFDKDMKAQDVVRGVPADTKRFSWSLTAPTLPSGQTRTDTFIGRIYHEYETSALGSIWVYSETEAEAARAAGRQMYSPSFTYTKGPVGVYVSVSPDPVVLYSEGDSFTINIKISNLAAGTIYSPGAVTYASGSENIALEADEINRVDVDITADSELSGYTDCEGTDEELIAGRDLTLVCDLTPPLPGTFKSYSFDVKVSYGYYTERTATVTVQGR